MHSIHFAVLLVAAYFAIMGEATGPATDGIKSFSTRSGMETGTMKPVPSSTVFEFPVTYALDMVYTEKRYVKGETSTTIPKASGMSHLISFLC